MLTLEDLEHATVHGETAKEAFAQAERRLAKLLKTKKAIEQKATTLVGAYITLSIVLVGASAGIYREGHAVAKALPFALSAVTFVDGAVVLVAALHRRQYGNLGCARGQWPRVEEQLREDHGHELRRAQDTGSALSADDRSLGR